MLKAKTRSFSLLLLRFPCGSCFRFLLRCRVFFPTLARAVQNTKKKRARAVEVGDPPATQIYIYTDIQTFIGLCSSRETYLVRKTKSCIFVFYLIIGVH